MSNIGKLNQQFKRMRDTLREVAGEGYDRHNSSRGKVSPSGVKTYNKLAKRFNKLFPDDALAVFPEDTEPSLVTHPKCAELLGQVETALDLLQHDVQATTIQADPVFNRRTFRSDSDLCFVLMPFRKELAPIYEDHIKKVVKKLKLDTKRADDFFNTSEIIEDIWESICTARLIIADLTDKNPNVFYEVGIAHTLGKNVVLITQSIDDVPFDLRHLRHIQYEYTPRGMQVLERRLSETIKNVLELEGIET